MLRTHIQSHAIGYLALFVALGGTAWAGTQLSSEDIAKNAIRAKHIKREQVKGSDVAADTLTGADIEEKKLKLRLSPGDVYVAAEADRSSINENDLPAECASGDIAVGGGGFVDESFDGTGSLLLTRSVPLTGTGSAPIGWEVTGVEDSPIAADWALNVVAICIRAK